MSASLRRNISTRLHRKWTEMELFSLAITAPDSDLWKPMRVPRGWEEAGKSVDARRRLMGLSIKELAKNAGIDPRTVADLIHARRWTFTEPTLANLERALAWKQGSIMNIALDGQEPEDEGGLAEIIKAWPTLSPDLRAALLRIVQD